MVNWKTCGGSDKKLRRNPDGAPKSLPMQVLRALGRYALIDMLPDRLPAIRRGESVVQRHGWHTQALLLSHEAVSTIAQAAMRVKRRGLMKVYFLKYIVLREQTCRVC